MSGTAGRSHDAAAGRERQPGGAGAMLKRVALSTLTALLTINILTGGPIFALWVGAQVQAAQGHLTMSAVGATVAVLSVVTYILYKALTLLNIAYNDAIGRKVPRRQVPWHKPMTGERASIAAKRRLTATERIVVGTLVLAVLAFEIWFFAFAHITLPS